MKLSGPSPYVQIAPTKTFQSFTTTIPDFRDLRIDGTQIVHCVWKPSASKRSAKIDTIAVPGTEFEQDRFKGRSLLVFRIDFFAYDDTDSLEELNRIVSMLFPPLSDTGIRLQAPIVHVLDWGPTRMQQFGKFVVSEDDGFVMYDDDRRCHKWGCVFRQFAQWKGPGVIQYHNASNYQGKLGEAATNVPSDPSIADPNSIQGTIGGTY